MSVVIGVRFKRGSKNYYFDPGSHEITLGGGVIVETARGMEYGVCTMPRTDVPDPQIIQPLRQVIRPATEQDMASIEAHSQNEKAALAVCQRKADKHGLDMKVVDCEYTFDGAKLLFYFTADGRVDFRELVKDLASEFHMRIELRQIGVRDEAKMLGGLGICGKPFCCSTFLDEFRPVSIKMAKEQNLSLNPVKISGTCGRLMCCLTYEQAAYEDLQRTTPRADSVVETPAGRGTVVDVNLLRGQVKVRLDSQPDAPPKLFDKCDLSVVSGGCGGCRKPRRPRPEHEAAPPPAPENGNGG